MQLQKKTYQQQSDLADYCRTAKLSPNLEVNPNKVKHYRRLVFNVINDNLQAAYPLTFNFLKEEIWLSLVNRFFANYKAQSPQIWKMPLEFFHYFMAEEISLQEKYPMLADLLNFEWSEIEIFMMEDREVGKYDPNGDLLHSSLVMNQESKIISVNFPVHLKPARKIKLTDSGQFFIYLYREKESGKVQFLDLPLIFALVLEQLFAGNTLDAIVRDLSDQIKPENHEHFSRQIFDFVNAMKNKKVVYGIHW